MMMRVCTKCKEPKVSEKLSGGFLPQKAVCTACYAARRLADNKSFAKSRGLTEYDLQYEVTKSLRQKAWRLKTQYGLEIEDYLRMKIEQEGCCCICKEKRTLVVDHSHTTGKVRGLICSFCNSGIGYFKDNPKALRRAADFLESD